MSNFSTAVVCGHLGRDAEAKAIGERFIISFTVATSRKVKDQETTTWWRINYWCKSDKFVQYLTKGTPVLVSGEPFTRKYEGKDGASKESLEIDAEKVKLLGGRQDKEAAPAAPSNPARPVPSGVPQEEPPF